MARHDADLCASGVIKPGQFGPSSSVFLPPLASFSFILLRKISISRTGMPSVIQIWIEVQPQQLPRSQPQRPEVVRLRKPLRQVVCAASLTETKNWNIEMLASLLRFYQLTEQFYHLHYSGIFPYGTGLPVMPVMILVSLLIRNGHSMAP